MKVATYGTLLHDVIKRAYNSGVIVLAAAGNESQFLDIYPAAYAEVISVGAVDIEGRPWSGTAYGDHVEVMAPGHSVYVANPREPSRLMLMSVRELRSLSRTSLA